MMLLIRQLTRLCNFNNRLDAELHGNRNKGFNDNKYASLEDVFAKEENKALSKEFHSNYRPYKHEILRN